MGLIGGILQPVYSGYPVTLIPHLTFLQRPYRWLKAISRFKATTSGGPNFAYDLCVRKIKPEQCDQLDLSNWSVAFNGAEPVYHKTLDQFASYFAPCGFRREAFLPCYGLAESTLLVTGGPKFRLPRKQSVLAAGLENNQVIFSDKVNADTRILVSCGKNLSDHQEIRIVNRETAMPCAADEIGEIWLQSPSVSTGYWNKPLENEVTFGARLATKDEGTFLRTGDLGFLSDGELFITGRIKDVIISEGKNHYPQDIEKTVETAHPNIWPSGGAAFSVASSGTEQIVVIAEVKYTDGVKEEEVIAAIRQAIAQNHGLSVGDIRLTIPGGLPRTTSGKIRHFLCKKNYMEGTFKQTIGI
jgi:acyl-CoA synthetase (AMP-forming)/AMP-acid ligase II